MKKNGLFVVTCVNENGRVVSADVFDDRQEAQDFLHQDALNNRDALEEEWDGFAEEDIEWTHAVILSSSEEQSYEWEITES